MTVVEIKVERGVADLQEAQRRLGDTGIVRRELGDTLNQAARVGEQSMKIYAPKGRTRGLERAIARERAHPTTSGAVEAAAGVGEVSAAGMRGSRRYPYDVHEGTGIFGHLSRLIRPKSAPFMVFPGKTGLVRTKTVRGQQAQPFVRDAYADVIAYVEQALDGLVDRILGRG
jgi:hypothetical protein